MATLRPGDDDRSVLGSLIGPVVLVAVAGLLGWILLTLAKTVIVALLYALGAALIVVPLLRARSLVDGRDGRERWRRIGTIVMVVAVGIAVILIAHLVSRHGWLLIVIPAGVVLVFRAIDHFADRREHRA